VNCKLNDVEGEVVGAQRADEAEPVLAEPLADADGGADQCKRCSVTASANSAAISAAAEGHSASRV